MEGGGPYAYPDPKSERGVTGFEVELMALLGKELGVTPGLFPGSVGQAAAGARHRGRIDLVINGYEWTAGARSRLPGDTSVLRLSIAIDGAARRPRSGAGPI